MDDKAFGHSWGRRASFGTPWMGLLPREKTMRRVTTTLFTRQECLQRAVEYAWLAENSRCEAAVAYAFCQARHWRSLALVAQVERLGEAKSGPSTVD